MMSEPGNGDLAGDWYVRSVERIEAAADELRSAIDGVVESLQVAGRQRSQDLPLVDIVRRLNARGGREHRLEPTVAFRHFESAVTAYRAEAVRALVDDDGLTFSAIAQLLGVSRQMVARLYRHGTGPALT
jgi:hypothetical protein